jgi:hypothetical protein
MIAPSSPARMIGTVISESSKKPPEIVLATSVDRHAPTTLSNAARITAVRGRRAPVAIGPAMALALSWKPFVKSKIRATTMTVITTNSSVTSVSHPVSDGRCPATSTPHHVACLGMPGAITRRRGHFAPFHRKFSPSL